MQIGQLRNRLLLWATAVAFVTLLGAAPVDQASAQGTQGYSGTQNGGSTTPNGTGTRRQTTWNGARGTASPSRLAIAQTTAKFVAALCEAKRPSVPCER